MWTKEEYQQLVWECEKKIIQLEDELASARKNRQFYIDTYKAEQEELMRKEYNRIYNGKWIIVE